MSKFKPGDVVKYTPHPGIEQAEQLVVITGENTEMDGWVFVKVYGSGYH